MHAYIYIYIYTHTFEVLNLFIEGVAEQLGGPVGVGAHGEGDP